MVCLHLWTCCQSLSDTTGVAQAGDLGAVILLGPATHPSSSYQLVFPFSSPVLLFGWQGEQKGRVRAGGG